EELRQSKGKDNLYVCSILAVKPDTGELKWYYQPVPGDSWDYDSVQGFILADLTINGRQRKTIMQENKDGFYYVLDRVSGAFISAQPFAQVTWAKGIDPETGRPIVNPEAHYEQNKETITLSPAPNGAHNWSPMSFNPITGLVYIPTTTDGTRTYSLETDFLYKPGEKNTGIIRAPQTTIPQPTLPSPPAIGPVPPPGQHTMLVAWDPVTQKERWRTPGGGAVGGGTVTSAGNLVFQVIPDGRLVAYSADKGEKLLEIQTGLRGGMGPPITWELDGKQYITLAGGTGAVAFGGPGGGGGGRGGAGAAAAPAAPAPAPPPPPAPPPAAPAAQNDGIHVQAEATPAPPPPPAPGRGGPPPAMPKMMTFVLDGKPMPAAEQK